jgi:catechol 2,3-dioxygenase-like lactoylglutathione lyase family enzyme
MASLQRVLETTLYCDDLDRAAAFYRDVLGARILFQDARLAAFDAGTGTVLLLFLRGASRNGVPVAGGQIPPHDGTGPAHVAFAVTAEDLPRWEARLVEAGIAIESQLSWPRGGRSIYIRDPEGHSVELATPGVWPTY